jgi:hypothetical protein
VRHLFLQSGLLQDQLAKIWSLSDLDQDGRLDIEEFIIAMRLTYDTINGTALPDILPEHLIPPMKLAQRKLNPNLDPLARTAGVPGIPTLASVGPNLNSRVGPSTAMPGMQGLNAHAMFQQQLSSHIIARVQFHANFLVSKKQNSRSIL